MVENTSPIVAKVCKHSNYSVSRFNRGSDLTCVKITNIHEDGGRSQSFISIKDYKQPYYIVKENKRKYKQHKDYIEESWCREYKAPRAQIAFNVIKQLYGRADYKASLAEAKESPYVFGLDQTPPVHIKHQFFKKYGEHQEKEPFTVAAYDVETDMDAPGNPIMMASVTMKRKAYFAAVRSWFKEPDDATILKHLKDAEAKWLSEHLERRQCVVQYELFDTPGQVVVACINKMHEWQPDWVASWNAEYDMTKNEEALRNEGYRLEDVYCDPSIPKEFRYYELNLGRTHKVKEDGSKMPLEPQEKWPTVRTMATWQWLDAMSFFCIKRQPSEGKLPDVSLEGAAKHVNVPGKLYTEEGAHIRPGTPQWHRYMQRKWPYLYCMYNIGDDFVIEEINEKTNDLSLSLPMLLKYSEYFNYVSQPKLVSDTLSFFARRYGFVWGSTPRKRDQSIIDKLPPLSNWIALLDTEKNADVGAPLFHGLADVYSTGRTDSSDIDVEGAYPHATLALNVGNRTTQMEVFRIQGADGNKFRQIGVNFASSAEANAIGLCHDLFRFPQLDQLKDEFERLMVETGREELLKEMQANARNRKSRINIDTEEPVQDTA
ncbi:hypothetical protein [Pseudomonas aeruginosa]|uniref:hypothetical protein n=1 Tax=Pseudomonas aeruginosa TaxID=287 RepID=UPI001154DA03|nr:hypothetical protein [Pseudomonas aeruginosa]TQH49588.1 hypothetical protein FLI59_30910 [Pseudomonas aeruginosa]